MWCGWVHLLLRERRDQLEEGKEKAPSLSVSLSPVWKEARGICSLFQCLSVAVISDGHPFILSASGSLWLHLSWHYQWDPQSYQLPHPLEKLAYHALAHIERYILGTIHGQNFCRKLQLLCKHIKSVPSALLCKTWEISKCVEYRSCC